MQVILFTFLFFFAIKKPPKGHNQLMSKDKQVRKRSQYTNIVRQFDPGNASGWKQPYIKIKVIEKSYPTMSCQEHRNIHPQSNVGM